MIMLALYLFIVIPVGMFMHLQIFPVTALLAFWHSVYVSEQKGYRWLVSVVSVMITALTISQYRVVPYLMPGHMASILASFNSVAIGGVLGFAILFGRKGNEGSVEPPAVSVKS